MAKKKSSHSSEPKSFEPATVQSAEAPTATTGRGLGATDIGVLIAMAATALAVGMGLQLQAGLRGPLAWGLAGGLFALLALIHIQRLRIDLPRAGDAADGAPVVAGRSEPALEPPPRSPQEPETSSYEDGAMDLAASKLAVAAAALRSGEPLAERLEPVSSQAALAPEAEAEPSLSWGEADAVDALVRQYAKDLERGEEVAWSSGVAAKAPATQPDARTEPSLGALLSEEPPLTVAIRKAAEGSVEVFLQPIVSFAVRKARMYEVFPRLVGPTGEIFGLSDYQPTAETLGLSLRVERAALLRCCAIQRRLADRGKAKAMIVRLSGTAIRDRAFLQRMLTDIQPDPLLANLIIFEVDQFEIEQGGGAERDNMDLLAAAGFRFSLGRAETLALEVSELTARRIAYVRVTPAILAADQSPVAVTELRNGGIETVLVGIEQDEDVRVGKAFGLVLGQGKLFSEPKPLRADVMGPAPGAPVPRPGKSRAA